MIPSDGPHSKPVPHDAHLYGERHPIECLIDEIKRFRRVATRYERTARDLLAMISLACAVIRLRRMSTRRKAVMDWGGP